MGTNTVASVWVGVFGYGGDQVVEVASTVRGLSDAIGASYSTMKSKAVKGGKFMIAVEGKESMRVWWVTRSEVRKVAGRGVRGKRGLVWVKGNGFQVIK